jgi:hypothetical protein
MPEMTYAVHTMTCTYLLDDDGVCRWTLSPSGLAAPGTDRCVGAQFVACLDLSAPGGLVGELVVGGAALFARSENGRLVLLRTLSIERVEYRPGPIEAPDPTAVLGPDDPWSLPPEDDAATPMHDPHTEPLSMDAVEAARVAFASLAEHEADADAVPLDLEDLLSLSVTEVTLSLPLYRPPVVLPPITAPPLRPASTLPPPPAPPRPPPPPSPSQAGRRGMIGPGRRLR